MLFHQAGARARHYAQEKHRSAESTGGRRSYSVQDGTLRCGNSSVRDAIDIIRGCLTRRGVGADARGQAARTERRACMHTRWARKCAELVHDASTLHRQPSLDTFSIAYCSTGCDSSECTDDAERTARTDEGERNTKRRNYCAGPYTNQTMEREYAIEAFALQQTAFRSTCARYSTSCAAVCDMDCPAGRVPGTFGATVHKRSREDRLSVT